MPKELETREVLKRLSSEGWILRSGKGSHVVSTRGTSMVTVPTA
ncbi:type II toxin-antitoxin system HicA family toxin [uncultured Enorma sp.]|nr:type II toxin-antitoxin system HicA family toxin [uncultured Enorma sp.]